MSDVTTLVVVRVAVLVLVLVVVLTEQQRGTQYEQEFYRGKRSGQITHPMSKVNLSFFQRFQGTIFQSIRTLLLARRTAFHTIRTFGGACSGQLDSTGIGHSGDHGRHNEEKAKE
jgi:hypothetical protein